MQIFSSIRIPSSVTNIGYCIFRWCNKLSEIIIPEGSKTQFEKLGKDKLVEQEQMTERGIKCRILFFDLRNDGYSFKLSGTEVLTPELAKIGAVSMDPD